MGCLPITGTFSTIQNNSDLPQGLKPRLAALWTARVAGIVMPLWSRRNLEGRAPSLMARDGWTSKTLQPGDEIILTIQPLRSGAPGGSWNTSIPKFKDGRPLQVTP